MKGRENVNVVAYEGVAIKAGEIASYVNDEFWDALYVWNMTKMWGLANGTIGWANEPQWYIETITAMESAHNMAENEEMAARNKEMQTRRPSSKG